MKSIAVVIPYIGSFRNDFRFWMKSVENNPTIDFLLFTDNNVSDAPQNLHVYKTSFEELKRRFQKFYDFPLCIPLPYKFCDLRGAYGEVFAEYLTDYDFWGYCDVDLVFGDIRKYVTEDILDCYDRIFGLGHFSLYRNTMEVNETYKLCAEPSYKQVFTFSEGCAFDEYWGTSRYWDLYQHDKFYQAYPMDDLDCYSYSFVAQMRRKEDDRRKNFIYAYEKGKTYRIYEEDGQVHREETMYVHFQKRDMEIHTEVSDKFMIVSNAYVPYVEVLTLDLLRGYCVEKKFYVQYYKLQWGRVINKIKKYVTNQWSKEYGKPQLPKDGGNYYCEKKDF